MSYSAPVARDRSVAMLMTDGDLARIRDLATARPWHDALSRAAHPARLHGAARCWDPRTFSALSQRLLRDPADATRWLAVGDAALACRLAEIAAALPRSPPTAAATQLGPWGGELARQLTGACQLTRVTSAS